jgi:hypothetical protein
MNEPNVVNAPTVAPDVVSSRPCYFCRDADPNPHIIYNHVLCDSCNTKLVGILSDHTIAVGKATKDIGMDIVNWLLGSQK